VDFEGVKTITQGFFQELFLPLLAEFGAEFLKSKLLVANVAPDIDEIMKSAFSNLDDYFDQRTIILNRECDEEI